MNSKIITLLAVSVAAVFGIVSFVVLQEGLAEVNTYDGPPKAIIIDQLYDEFPNQQFHDAATKYVELGGYTMDIVTTQDIDVDFYKNLPQMNYQLVIVRTHGSENVAGDEVVLFTGEKYTEDKYITEQLTGLVKKATPLLEIAYSVGDQDGSSEWVIVNDTYSYLKGPAVRIDKTENAFFAISPSLVKDGMKGKFDDTVFLLGGCNTLSNPSLAKSLVDRGASAVLGWDDPVGSMDNDQAMLRYLQSIFDHNLENNEALSKVSNLVTSKNMAFPANFIQYPDL